MACFRFSSRTPPPNLLGSLLGVFLMFLVSFLWTPPAIWFGASFLVLVFFTVRRQKSLLFVASSAVLAIIILAWPVNPLWNRDLSPKQLIELGYGDNGLLIITAAGHYYQRVYNLSNSTTDSVLRRIRNYYELPYLIAGRAGDVGLLVRGQAMTLPLLCDRVLGTSKQSKLILQFCLLESKTTLRSPAMIHAYTPS